jgi:hypothetical protein
MNLDFTSRKSFTTLIAAFIVHNMEEAFFICRYPVVSPFSFIQPASCRQFLWAVSILTFVGILVSFLALTTKKKTVYLFISTALAATILFNVFVPHILLAVYTFHYTPGLLSAVLLNLPISLIVIIKNRKLYHTKSKFVKQIVAGLAIGYIAFATVMLLVLHLV